MFTDYTLSENVLKTLQNKGFTTPTPIQAATLPHSLAGRDILGQARTGTGKTLAFGLPMASGLETDRTKGRAPRAFILTPTRELALQVAGELEWVAPHLSVVTVYGGTGYGKQASDLKRGCDIVVATPGRAIDYMQRGVLDLGGVQFVVLDEADEMLSMGFEEDVETLLAATPSERQTMFFSATLPRWAKNLAKKHLVDPEHADLMREEEVSYEELAIEANVNQRLGILSDLLHAHHGEKTIIFTHTKAEVDKLAKELNANGHGAEAIHGDLNQTQRERVLARFRSGQVNALIGTNVAARGLDIPEVDLVVHYRIPSDTDAYQHRSGRTGRAGREGTVVLLYGTREKRDLALLERAVARKFTKTAAPTPERVQDLKLERLLSNAQSQSEEDKTFWRETAEELLESGDSETLAGLFALLLGGAPAPKSLLTGEEGWVTLGLEGNIGTVGHVVRQLKDADAGELGRIELTVKGAYADVRPDKADLDVDTLEVSKARAPLTKPRSKPQGKPNRRRSRGRAEARR